VWLKNLWKGLSSYIGWQNPSSVIAIQSLLTGFCKNLFKCQALNYNLAPPIIIKPMAKQKWSTAA
jgi:uncharacterized membrane protein